MFRFKKSIPLPYHRQGYVYFMSRKYAELPERQQRKIDRLCYEAGGKYAEALHEFLTTDRGETAICMRHGLSENTLRACVKRYYMAFPERL